MRHLGKPSSMGDKPHSEGCRRDRERAAPVPSITAHFGIDDPVPFVDVDVSIDNRLFVDPRAIRLQGPTNPIASHANRCTESFFATTARNVLSSNPADHRTGRRLLQKFEEPWETRLGLAANGFSGHGGADDVGVRIWDTLSNDVEALLRVGLLREVEDLPLFVEGIDRDIMSDITTRIIFQPLADFTADIVASFPQFTSRGRRVGNFQRQVWDPSTNDWGTATVQLPVVNSRPLLLVPASWVSANLLMSAGRYYETSVLSYAQLEQAVYSRSGRLLTTPKRLLKKQPGLGRGRATNLRVTQRAVDGDADLLASFKSFVDARWLQRQRELASSEVA